ncbi:MAG TPA: CapA family protein [Polyangiales bacterium]|nr:CapA family protein [Polyangiales bacterium]
MSDSLRVLLVGDLILEEPEPDSFFELARSVLCSAGLVIGHVEVPHTRRGQELGFDVPAPAADPDHLAALPRAGFHVATLAGNHIFDRGPEGISDTRSALTAGGIASCGAGLDLASARAPAVFERNALRVGVLSYNCVGPRESWAGEHKAGCAFVRVVDRDGNDCNGPGAAALKDSQAEGSSLAAMQADVSELRARTDLLIVALHKGIVHTPALLAGYERPLAHAAVEAGADIVVGHHAHILRGVEVFQGRPIFHGLGNFVTVTRALDLDNAHPARRAWAQKRRELFGFTPDPAYPNYPFHPEAKHALIADCRVDGHGRVSPGFVPCWILPSGQPEPLAPGRRAQAVLDYVAAISRTAGLETSLDWDGDRIVFQ